MNYAELLALVERRYGEAGVYALESSCLTYTDLLLGEEHCLAALAPAIEELEEELMNRGEL